MKLKKYLYLPIAALLLFGAQSCFQDLDHPGFNYPEQPDPPAYSPLKLFYAFEDNVADSSNYDELTVATNITYGEGVNESAYQGSASTYAVVNPKKAVFPGDVSTLDSLANMDNVTVAFWMHSTKVDKATGLLSMSNTKEFWGNFDIFLESNGSETEAFFKVYVRNGGADRWVTKKIDNVFKKWTHVAFRYNGTTSEFSIFFDGTLNHSVNLGGFGPLRFNNMGPIAIGTLQFQTEPSLTTGANAESWAQHYSGKLDQFRLYNEALSDSEITSLYSTKE